MATGDIVILHETGHAGSTADGHSQGSYEDIVDGHGARKAPPLDEARADAMGGMARTRKGAVPRPLTYAEAAGPRTAFGHMYKLQRRRLGAPVLPTEMHEANALHEEQQSHREGVQLPMHVVENGLAIPAFSRRGDPEANLGLPFHDRRRVKFKERWPNA